MKVLVVHADHEPQSLCSALKNLTVDVLAGAKIEVRQSDLHAMHWNPVLSAADCGPLAGPMPADIGAEIEKIEWCDLLILNFPLLWFAAPAILKGWIDRVFARRVQEARRPGRRKSERKAMLTVALDGHAAHYGPSTLHSEMDTLLHPLQRGALKYAGFSVLPPFLAYHLGAGGQPTKAGILADYRTRLGRLQQLAALD